jgi:AcrR family transcriptional regulator
MSAETPPDRNAQRSEATRTALVGAARRLFAERGYARVGTEEIVRAAGVTRGALYHHFAGGKTDLFHAVAEAVEMEIVQRIAGEMAGATDPYAALELGGDAWLRACTDGEVQQIALLDAPSVLGWEEWRELGMRYGLGALEATLAAAMESGQLAQAPVRPLAHLLLGAMDEAGLVVARAEDQEATLAEMSALLRKLLAGLRA